MRSLVRYAYVPFMLVAVAGSAIWLAAENAPQPILPFLVVAAIAASFLAERIAPTDLDWNVDHNDARRDVVHTLVNEGVVALSLAALPVLAGVLSVGDSWPHQVPFFAQVLGAVLVFDLGVTLAHLASHRIELLWRFHAVHHSARRLYGLNGLMKHPVHQMIETTAGITPLLLIGIPENVAAALAACAAIQLLLQHSNVDYRVGRLGTILALNTAHRLHHLRWPGVGDVNFGLFTLIWDRLLGTYTPPGRIVTTDQLGIAARPDYPTRYLAQLAEPFRSRPSHPENKPTTGRSRVPMVPTARTAPSGGL
jgi:sterol desaturase/sphingolipid hydroxylase (fatty acid hydroxylase superfamily)